AGRHLARRLDQHERDAVGPALLVTLQVAEDRLRIGAGAPERQVSRPQQVGNLEAQLVAAGQTEGAQQAYRNRLAVPVALVTRGGLDRVADRVAEVQGLAAALVAPVLGG